MSFQRGSRGPSTVACDLRVVSYGVRPPVLRRRTLSLHDSFILMMMRSMGGQKTLHPFSQSQPGIQYVYGFRKA